MDKFISNDLVSIIMPAYNAANYIEESISSVRLQTHKNWELIIVDDGSTDDTAFKIKYFQIIDERIKYLYQKNKKQAAARNLGISKAKGEWIAFLDADDLWLSEKLELQLSVAANSIADLIFTQGYYLKGDGILEPYDSLKGTFNGKNLYSLLYKHNHIAILSVLLRRRVAISVAIFDERPEMQGCEDWDYWLQLTKKEIFFEGIENRLFKYRVHSLSTSKNLLQMHKAGLHTLCNNFNKQLITEEKIHQFENVLLQWLKFIIDYAFANRDLQLLESTLNNLRKLNISFKYTFLFYLTKLLGLKSVKWLKYLIYKVIY